MIKVDLLKIIAEIIILILCTVGVFPWWFFLGVLLLSLEGFVVTLKE